MRAGAAALAAIAAAGIYSLYDRIQFAMNDELDKHVDLWDKCDVFIIEKQMMFGKQTNPMAVKLAQHCYSYFVFKYGRFKKIIEFPAYNKTQVLGALKNKVKNKYKSIPKPQRKKWCINKALEILEERKDNNTIQQILLSKTMKMTTKPKKKTNCVK